VESILALEEVDVSLPAFRAVMGKGADDVCAFVQGCELGESYKGEGGRA
jgi:hypothetical protein